VRLLNYNSTKLRDKLDELGALEVSLEFAAYLLNGLSPFPTRQPREQSKPAARADTSNELEIIRMWTLVSKDSKVSLTNALKQATSTSSATMHNCTLEATIQPSCTDSLTQVHIPYTTISWDFAVESGKRGLI
jgi:hypothetical protein